MPDVPYRLVDSVVRVHGVLTTTEDDYDDPQPTVEDVKVELVHRGAEVTQGSRRVLRTGKGDQELGVVLTPDGRLQSVEYKNIGVGPAVLTAGVKLVAFIGSVALSAVRAGALAGQVEDDERREKQDPREAWKGAHPEAAALLEKNKELAKEAAEKLAAVRKALVSADDLAAARTSAALERMIAAVVDEARAEVARLESTYKVWRDSKTTVRTASLDCVINIEDIPARPATTPGSAAPSPPDEGAPTRQLYTDFKVLLEVVDPRASGNVEVTNQPQFDGRREAELVRWRVPRPVELWVWKEDADGDVVLVTRSPVRIADERSDTYGMELRASFFGEHGGSWAFNDDGSPGTIKANDRSAAGALANALAAVPDTLVSAVEQAKKLTDSIGGIQEAAAEREKAAAERDLATAKARVELLGVNATAADVAALARAEQAVKLRTATRGTSSDADAVDDLKQELELTKTRDDLAAQRRSAALEGELAGVKAEVARLEQEVALAKAKYDVEHPGPPESDDQTR